ncbi:MAG: ribosome hibernation-promoting factor, HPF/YfiA family [Thermoanaerobaculia bacterium]
MSVELTGRNVTVTPALKRLAQRRITRLERHLAGPARVRIVVWREKHLFTAEAIATHRRRRWTAEEKREDLAASVAFAIEKIDAQARKDTEKRRDRKHRGARSGAGNGRSRERRDGDLGLIVAEG